MIDASICRENGFFLYCCSYYLSALIHLFLKLAALVYRLRRNFLPDLEITTSQMFPLLLLFVFLLFALNGNLAAIVAASGHWPAPKAPVVHLRITFAYSTFRHHLKKGLKNLCLLHIYTNTLVGREFTNKTTANIW